MTLRGALVPIFCSHVMHILLSYARITANIYGRRAFSVAGPTVWDTFSDYPGPDNQCGLFPTFT